MQNEQIYNSNSKGALTNRIFRHFCIAFKSVGDSHMIL